MAKKDEWIDDFMALTEPPDDDGLEIIDPDPNWEPKLSYTQKLAYDSKAKFILIHGEKYSGKSYVAGGHKLIKHCYENSNALAIMVVGNRSQATQGGCWTKLWTEILPDWVQNKGLEHSEEKSDVQHLQYFWIRNVNGGWSKVVLISMEHALKMKKRFRGFEPTYLYVDELTTFPRAVLTWGGAQVGRSRWVKCQQFVATTNPEGQSHWVYKAFWEEVVKDGKRDPDYQVFYLPYAENAAHDHTNYRKTLEGLYKHDPIEYARMLSGEWIDKPSGDSIFGAYFDKRVNVRGSLAEKQFIMPNKRFPIIIGYDLGQTHNAIIFMQRLVGGDHNIWTVFDELIWIKERVVYAMVSWNLLERMAYWNRAVNHTFNHRHISDDSAINNFRPNEGSVDAADVERFTRELIKKHDPRFKGINPVQMEGAPKYAGSVKDKVKLIRRLSASGSLLLSAKCTGVIDMMMNLESEKEKEGEWDPEKELSPKRSKHLHAFDAMAYPILKLEPMHSSFEPQVTPEIYTLGKK